MESWRQRASRSGDLRWIAAILAASLSLAATLLFAGAWTEASANGTGTTGGTGTSGGGTTGGGTTGGGTGGTAPLVRELEFHEVGGDQLSDLTFGAVGQSKQVSLHLIGAAAGDADTLQVLIGHNPSITSISNAACIGEFDGAITRSSAPYVASQGGTAMVCVLDGAPIGGAGDVLQFTVTKVGAGTDSLTLKSTGHLRTTMFSAGIEVPFGNFDSIEASGGVAPTPTPTAAPVSGGGGGGAPPPASAPATAPSSPTGVQAVAGNKRATVTWVQPANDGGSPILQYRIFIFGGGSLSVDAAYTSYTFGGMENGTEYQFTVAATNAIGSSSPSDPSDSVTPFGPPTAPTNVSVSSPGSGRLRVSWEPPESDEGSPIIGYRIVEVSSQLPGRDHTGSANSVEVSDVRAGTYSFLVAARNAAGQGATASSGEFELAEVAAGANASTVRTSPSSSLDDSELDELEEALRRAGTPGATRTGTEVSVVVAGGRGIVSLPVSVDATVETASLSIQTDSLALDVVNGRGTVSVTLGAGISVRGDASLTRDESGQMSIRIDSPRLLIQPQVSVGGAASAVEFDVGLVDMPEGAGFDLAVFESAEETGITTQQIVDAAVGAGLTLSTTDQRTGFAVSVTLSGIDNSLFADNRVTLSVDSDWAGLVEGRSIYLVKVSDSGQTFVAAATCTADSGVLRCTATFDGEAAGFSTFTALSAANQLQLKPTVIPTRAPTASPIPVATSTPAPEPTGVAVPAGETLVPTQAPSSPPTPTSITSVGPAAAAGGGGGGATVIFIVLGTVGGLAAAGGGGAFLYARRRKVPASLVIVLAACASVLALPSDTMAIADDSEPPATGIDLPADLVERLRDQIPYQYRRMDSATNAAYRTALGLPNTAPVGDIDEQGRIDVYIWHEGDVDAVVTVVDQIGGIVYNAAADVIEASVPADLLPALNYAKGVLRVSQIVPPVPLEVISQGVSVHNADDWQVLGLDGSGVKVGILDVGFIGYSALIGSEVPTPTGVRCYTAPGTHTAGLDDCESRTVHGTAVTEAVIDIAPSAGIYLANPVTFSDLQDAVSWMIGEGVQIINHSAGWTWTGPGDGTSIYSSAPVNTVDTAVSGGVLWVNSAGNEARSGWFGSWADQDDDGFLDFNDGINFQAISLAAFQFIALELRWEDSWPYATESLNLFLFDESMNVVGASGHGQAGGIDDTPYESLIGYVTSAGTYYVAVERGSVSLPDWVQVRDLAGADFSDYTSHHSIGNPADSSNPGMLAVGAANHATTSTIESFSSEGPTTDGRIKPDIVGADRGDSVTYGAGGFAGTSQASPHVAGMAALVLERYPNLTPSELADYLKGNAAERGSAGADNIWGHGFAQLPALLPPLGAADSYDVLANESLNVSAEEGVLSNDSDPESDPINAVLQAGTSDGALTFNSDGSFTYAPNTDFIGTDSFVYRVSDGLQESLDATVTLDVFKVFDVSGSVALEAITDGAAVSAIGPSVTITLEQGGTLIGSVDPDGSFVIADVREGTHVIEVMAGGFVKARRASLVVGGANVDMPAIELPLGDADMDGEVDIVDIQVVANSFGSGPTSGREDGGGNTVDLDADGFVNGRDLSLALRNVGVSGPGSW